MDRDDGVGQGQGPRRGRGPVRAGTHPGDGCGASRVPRPATGLRAWEGPGGPCRAAVVGRTAAATRRNALRRALVPAAAPLTLGCSFFGATRSAKPVTLEFWGGPNPAQRQDQVRVWNAAHARATLKFVPSSTAGQGVEALRKFAAAVAAHTAPSLIDFDRFQTATYANWRVFRPLDDLVARDKVDLDGFLSAALDEATGFDKKRYGLPNSTDTRLVFWNKDHFAAAGLGPERPPATWDDLRVAAARCTRSQAGKLEQAGFDTEQGQSSLFLFAWQNGGSFQSADGKKVTLPQPANVEALQYLVDLIGDSGGWPAISAARSGWGGDARDPFVGRALSLVYQVSSWAGDVLGRFAPDLSFGVAPPPVRHVGEAPLSWSGGYAYVLSRDAPAPDAAWDAGRWLVGEESVRAAYAGETQRAKASGGVYLPGLTGQPALDRRLAAEFKTGNTAVDSVLDVALSLLPRTRTRERSIAAPDLWDGVLRAQSEAVSLAKSPQDALSSNNSQVQRALDQAWVFAPR